MNANDMVAGKEGDRPIGNWETRDLTERSYAPSVPLRGAAERIWRLEPADLAFRLQFRSEMPGDIGRHRLRPELGDTEPGEYVLAARIQDADSNAYSLPALTDVFVAER